MSRVYRAAIVGCGRKAATLDDEERCRVNYSIPPDAHAAAYGDIPGVELVAAADPNEPKRRLMQERWAVPAVYADYREMLRRERPDLVSVTTRVPLHAEVTIEAARHGARGVLCEKAMATSLREADAMVEACREAGAVLVVNHTRRWHPTYIATRAAIADGAIGELGAVVATCPGPLIHNGTHAFDLMRFFGGDAAWVSGVLAGPADGDVAGRAMLGFAGGAIGFADLDGRIGLAIELHGSTGRIVIDPATEGFTVWEYRRPPRPADRAWYQGSVCPERHERHVVAGHGRGTLVAAIEDVIAAVEGRAPSRSSGEDGRAALELSLAVYQSHTAGGLRVPIPMAERDLTVVSR